MFLGLKAISMFDEPQGVIIGMLPKIVVLADLGPFHGPIARRFWVMERYLHLMNPGVRLPLGLQNV